MKRKIKEFPDDDTYKHQPKNKKHIPNDETFKLHPSIFTY